MNKRNRYFALFVAVFICAAIIFGFLPVAAPAFAVTQAEIDELKEKSADLKSQKADVQAEIDGFEYEENSVLAKKAILDKQVMLTEDEIDNINAQIAAYEELIAQKTVEVEEAQKREDDQLAAYKLRIRIMEENGNISYLSVLFEADSFSDFLARLDFIKAVMNYDEELYRDYIEAKEETAAAKESLEDSKAEQELAREELEDKEAELQKQVEEACAYIQEIEDNIETSQAYWDELDALQEELDKEISEKQAELQRQIEEEERRRREEEAAKKRKEQEEAARNNQGSSSSNGYGSGSFVWPAPSCYIITSDFGSRVHPIYNTVRNHNGIDIGASYGSNIYAADSGVVTAAYYHWSYGNMVMVDHGNGYVTLYAHMSRIAVSVGTKVTKGSTILGYVGSTGDSTGAHLHFEIRYNGSYCDPKAYLSGYNYTIWD